MSSLPLPSGWVSVQYQDPSGPLDPNAGTCATLLGASSAESSKPTASCLNTLLNASYLDLNGVTAGVTTQQPLFYLYYRKVTSNGPICVAFYKTLNTTSRGATSVFVQPTRRWWCVTLGVAQTPASGWSYPYVRDICAYFYYQVMTPAIGDFLVVAEDHNRTGDANNIEADACSKKLARDDLITKTVLKSAEAAYFPWSHVKHIKPGKQMDFTQLTF